MTNALMTGMKTLEKPTPQDDFDPLSKDKQINEMMRVRSRMRHIDDSV